MIVCNDSERKHMCAHSHTHLRYNNYISVLFSLLPHMCVCMFVHFFSFGLIYLAKFLYLIRILGMRKHTHAPDDQLLLLAIVCVLSFDCYFQLILFGNHERLPCLNRSSFVEKHMRWINYKQSNSVQIVSKCKQ